MSKIILSTRIFRPEFIAQIERIAPDYQFKTAEENFSWEDVEITIGWSKKWQSALSGDVAKQLKWVQAISAGVDYLPLQEFQEKNILLSNGSGIHSQSITEHILAMILIKTRNIHHAIQNQQKKQWDMPDIRYSYLAEQRFLILGTGHIGQRLAQTLTLLGAQPVGINTSGHPAKGFHETYTMGQLSEEIPKADFIINILPLTEETTHLFDAKFFASMKKTAAFINVGRGASVDTDAITHAIQTKQLDFAALDVFEEEPLPEDHPLWQLPNVLITPHIAGITPHFQRAFMEIFTENLRSYVTSNSLIRNEVVLNKGY